ncbi:MAG TPA: hypothetical protein VFP34_13470 [Microlunatus sp.]|nr:hypothetical protein [Microlunatus sp.]
MTRSTIIKLFVGSVIGFAAAAVLLIVAGVVAFSGSVFVMSGSDVVGVRGGPLAPSMIALAAFALLVMAAAGVVQFVTWIGVVLNTAELASKGWLVATLVVGLLGFVFIANLIYVIAGPDGHQQLPPPTMGTPGQLESAPAQSTPADADQAQSTQAKHALGA